MIRSKTMQFLNVTALLLMTGCFSSKNLYMSDGTNEFNSVTKCFLGNWNINSYSRSGEEVINSIFTKGTLSLDHASREAVFTFWVSDSFVNSKLTDWKVKWPDLEVNEYKVISSGTWKISKSGEILYFEDMVNSIDIKGTGENFEGFFGSEQMKFTASEHVGSDAGLGGMLARAATKKVTGTEILFPKVFQQYNFEISPNKESINVKGINSNSFDIARN